MAGHWYYAWQGVKLGPYSALQLQELAEAGKIQPTDTIYKEGVDEGVPAARVENLFPPDPVCPPEAASPAGTAADASPVSQTTTEQPGEIIAPPMAAGPEPVSEQSIIEPLDASNPEVAVDSPAAAEKPASKAIDSQKYEKKVRKGRAIAVRGAIIVHQDGNSVQYRKKCVKCGHEDASRARAPIVNGLMRSTFFCTKCRKLQPIEIQGQGL
jgi:GYF domain 2